MARDKYGDVVLVLVWCAVAAIATSEILRTIAIFAVGWNASWAIQGEER